MRASERSAHLRRRPLLFHRREVDSTRVPRRDHRRRASLGDEPCGRVDTSVLKLVLLVVDASAQSFDGALRAWGGARGRLGGNCRQVLQERGLVAAARARTMPSSSTSTNARLSHVCTIMQMTTITAEASTIVWA